MKTIKQIMEGVTADGQWEVWKRGSKIGSLLGETIGQFDYPQDAAFAARACSSWRAVVEALQVMEQSERWKVLSPDADALRQAQAALAEALKD